MPGLDAAYDLPLLCADVHPERLPDGWAEQHDSQDCLTVLAGDALGARAEARVIIDRINDALAADSPLHGKLHTGSIFEQDAAKPLGYSRCTFGEIGPIALSVEMSATGSVTQNGYIIASSRTLGLRQRELEQADSDFAAALRLFKIAGDDIRLLFIVWEYIKEDSGIDLSTVSTRRERATFLETADNRPNVRHRGGKRPNAYEQMSGVSARNLIRRMLVGWVELRVPH